MTFLIPIKTVFLQAFTAALAKIIQIDIYKVMELTYEALLLTKSLLHKTNTNALSDLGVSALSLKAASQGAWLNVLINVNSIKDETIAKDLKSKGQTLLSKSIALADEIYLEIEQDLD